MRMHLGMCKPSGTPYEKYRPIRMQISHLGPYTGTPYGTEEDKRCGTVVMEKGRMHCIEWRLKMNSVTGPVDLLGNGQAVNDGVITLWVDGVERWSKTDFAFRRHQEIGIMGPWIVWVHGGRIPPSPGEILHYKLGSYACAKRYIGPRLSITN